MSVHLVGARFGTILEGDSKSGGVLQAELALEWQGQPFSTIFWSPADLASAAITEPAQRAFINRLEGLSVDAGRAEFVRSPLEQLKALVLSRIANAGEGLREFTAVSSRSS
jgi:hypothetical protein